MGTKFSTVKVYWSKKEDRDLVYYTSEDIARATITLIPNDDSFLAAQWYPLPLFFRLCKP